MELLIKQRVFSWTDSYDIYDHNMEPKYYVKAEFLSIGHVLHIYSHDTDEEIGEIREKVLTFLPKAEISVGGRMIGTITKQFTIFSNKYSLDCNGWEIEGDFMGWDYEILSGERSVATISKRLFSFSDTYEIDVHDPADEIEALLVVLTIDMMNCGND